RADAGLADLGAIAGVAVGAGGAVRDRHVGARARVRVAGVGGAGIVVVAVLAGAGLAHAGLARAGRVAGAARRAAGAIGHGRVLATRLRIAAIGRARVVVVAAERRALHAHAGLADLGAVADVVVGAGHPVGHRRVHTLEVGVRIAAIGRARIAVVTRRRALRLR